MRFAGFALALIILALPAAAQVQRDAPIGAYPPGSGSDGRAPIGSYPPSRPAPTVRPPDAPAQRQPDAHEQIIERQRSEERRQREAEEIRRSLPNRP